MSSIGAGAFAFFFLLFAVGLFLFVVAILRLVAMLLTITITVAVAVFALLALRRVDESSRGLGLGRTRTDHVAFVRRRARLAFVADGRWLAARHLFGLFVVFGRLLQAFQYVFDCRAACRLVGAARENVSEVNDDT